MSETITLKLRNAAKNCSSEEWRGLLRHQADLIEYNLRAVVISPDDETMRQLIGVWAHAERLLDQLPPEGSTPPLSGPSEPAILAS